MTTLRRLAAAYDRSRRGRRLARRLRLAMVDTTPARWRTGQLLVLLPLVVLGGTIAGVPGLVLAVGLTRAGSLAVLRAGARRRDSALERGAPAFARRLGAELAAGACVGDALAAATASSPATERALRPIAREAVVRTTLGEPPGAALSTAAAASGVDGPGLRAVAALLTLQGRSGGDPRSFERLAAALEAAIATRDDARALTAEARLAAVGVPTLSAVLAATLALTQPAIAAGVATPAAAAVLGGCATVALAGTMLARRLAASP